MGPALTVTVYAFKCPNGHGEHMTSESSYYCSECATWYYVTDDAEEFREIVSLTVYKEDNGEYQWSVG